MLNHTLRFFFWLTCAVVAVGSLTPVEHLPPLVFDLWDKAQHAVAFVIMTVLGLVGYGRSRRGPVCGGLLGYGAAIELGQWLTGWRQGDLLDLTADGIGIAAGLALYLWWHRAGRAIRTTSR